LEIWQLTATELKQKIADGEISAREATKSHLSRMSRLNDKLNAVVESCEAEALKEADAVDKKRQKGDELGALAGVPVTVKVNVDQKGYATTNGLQLQKDLIAKTDNPVVNNLRRAEAIIIGRTNTPAFSLRWFTRNTIHGHTKNPLNPLVTPGGSSGGAAAAVAAGIGTIGHGTDIAGSIRYPAYACGIHGLRPSLGRVAAHNFSGPDRFIGGQLMAVSGPLARCIEDLELGLEVMANPNYRDPWSMGMPLKGEPYAKRFAFCDSPEGIKVDPRIKQSLGEARNKLEKAGWVADEVKLPPLRSAMENQLVLWMAEMDKSAKHLVRKENDPDAIIIYERLRKISEYKSPDQVMGSLQERANLTRQWKKFLFDYPLLLCPVSCSLPFDDLQDLKSDAHFEQIIEDQILQIGLPFMGLPGLTVTTDRNENRPVGVQLVASHFREDILLDAAKLIAPRFDPI
jgi:amidase